MFTVISVGKDIDYEYDWINICGGGGLFSKQKQLAVAPGYFSCNVILCSVLEYKPYQLISTEIYK